MNIEKVNNMICVDCQTSSVLLANLHMSINDIACLFYTISPDVELNDYNNKLPDQQWRSINLKFNAGIRDLNKHIKVHGYTMHYEFNKSGNLHVHGLIITPQHYQGYEKNCIITSKIFHRLFGRPRMPCSIACRVEWVKDIAKVAEYVNKSNVYPPVHKILEHWNVTKYLAKGDKAPEAPPSSLERDESDIEDSE